MPEEFPMIFNLQSKTRVLPAVVYLSFVFFAGCQSKQEPVDIDELQAFATRYAEAWSGQDPAVLASFYATDGILRVNEDEPSIGRKAIEETARGYMTAFPDMVIRLVELRQEGEHTEFHWHWTGTNTGPGGTGNSVDLTGYERWRIGNNGLIQESVGHFDELEYQRQLNLDTQDD